MNFTSRLQKRIDKQTPPPRQLSTEKDVVAYYQANSPGSWRQALIADLMDISVKGETKKSLARRFNPSRMEKAHKTSKKNQEQYAKLGALHGDVLMPPRGGYRIYGVLDLRISGECGYVRDHTWHITGQDAYDFANGKANFDMLIRQYFDKEPDLVQNVCKVYQLDVEAVD